MHPGLLKQVSYLVDTRVNSKNNNGFARMQLHFRIKTRTFMAWNLVGGDYNFSRIDLAEAARSR